MLYSRGKYNINVLDFCLLNYYLCCKYCELKELKVITCLHEITTNLQLILNDQMLQKQVNCWTEFLKGYAFVP